MSDFDNTNSGALHKNDRKSTPTQPDYKGDAAPVCVHCGAKQDFWLSAWIKTARSGKKWMSIAFQAKDDPRDKQADNNGSTDFDDDIPF